jgi:hypothetical protein
VRPKVDRRRNPRLKLSYPIELSLAGKGRCSSTRAVTRNLSARGAYFTTFCWRDFEAGQKVVVRIQVPHRLQEGADSIQLHMSAEGKLRRVGPVSGAGTYGEDGVALGGIAVEFDAPLEFRYLWM